MTKEQLAAIMNNKCNGMILQIEEGDKHKHDYVIAYAETEPHNTSMAANGKFINMVKIYCYSAPHIHSRSSVRVSDKRSFAQLEYALFSPPGDDKVRLLPYYEFNENSQWAATFKVKKVESKCLSYRHVHENIETYIEISVETGPREKFQ